MKTTYTLLTWIFGIFAFTMLFVGVLIPVFLGGLGNQELFLFGLSMPFGLLAIFFRDMAKKRAWDDDFFYLLFKFSSSKGKELKKSLKTGIEDSKEKMKNNTHE